MKCSEVKEKLPEYLAGVLDDNEAYEIKQHIDSCKVCKREVDELNDDVLKFNKSDMDVNNILRKTQRKFNSRIVRVVAIVLAIAWVIYMVPVVLWGLWSFNQPKASRALMDIVQFSQPQKVNSWGNKGVDRSSLSVPLTITALPQIGKKYGQQISFDGKMSVITGKVTAPFIFGAQFIHPNLFKGIDYGRDRSPAIQQSILLKNAETSVATVDYSFSSLLNLQDISNLLGKYDVEVCWMAVESGIESITFKNMTFANQQVLQWGIPGKLTKPGSFDFEVLTKDNYSSFEKAAIDEMKWLDKNNQLIKPNSDFKYVNKIKDSTNGKIDNDGSFKYAIRYIIENGIKIYGLRVTGPSSELIKLSKDLDVRTMSVVDMDFWNW